MKNKHKIILEDGTRFRVTQAIKKAQRVGLIATAHDDAGGESLDEGGTL